MRKLCAAFVLLMATSIGTGAAAAAQAAGDPESFLRDFGARAIAQVADSSTPPAVKAERFRTLIDEGFEVVTISRFVAGRYWRKASESERRAFVQVFREYLLQRFLTLFDAQEGYGFDIRSVRTDMKNPSVSWVSATIDVPEGAPVSTEWRVRHRGDRHYSILDVKAEGSSMAITLRDEFLAVMRTKGGLSGLTEVMQGRIYGDAAEAGTTGVLLEVGAFATE